MRLENSNQIRLEKGFQSEYQEEIEKSAKKLASIFLLDEKDIEMEFKKSLGAFTEADKLTGENKEQLFKIINGLILEFCKAKAQNKIDELILGLFDENYEKIKKKYPDRNPAEVIKSAVEKAVLRHKTNGTIARIDGIKLQEIKDYFGGKMDTVAEKRDTDTFINSIVREAKDIMDKIKAKADSLGGIESKMLKIKVAEKMALFKILRKTQAPTKDYEKWLDDLRQVL